MLIEALETYAPGQQRLLPIMFYIRCSMAVSLLLRSLVQSGNTDKEVYPNIGPITGAVPCCIDRLTSIVCKRIKQKNGANFLHSCLTNPDFAFVQCCRTCFAAESDNEPFQLNYQKVVDNLLMSPRNKQTCYDRRSQEWCNDFVMRQSIWSQPNFRKYNCASMAIAFRECRHACGYCRLNEDETNVANYDYKLATDPISCHNPSYGLAFHRVDLKKIFQKFDQRFANYMHMMRLREAAGKV